MAPFQPDWVRKQRHSKAIIRRNNLRRQLLLKQDEPDVGDISESSEESLPEGVVPVYWRANQSDGYDSRLKWRRGPSGKFYYDSREGSRTFGRDDIFLNDEERDEVIEKLTEYRGGSVNSIAASQIYEAALTGSTGDRSSNTMDTYIRMVDAHLRQGSTPDDIRQAIEVGATNIRSRYESDLRDQGIFTTRYVNSTASEDPELDEYREADIESVEPSPSRRREQTAYTFPHQPPRQSHGVLEEVYERLSDWGKASLADNSLISNNRSLFGSLTQVLIVDAGDAVVPATHSELGVTVTNSRRKGRPLRAGKKIKTDAFPEGVYLKAWRASAEPRGLLEQANAEIREYNRQVDDGSIEGPRKREATTLSWDEWMEERDKTFQVMVARQQEGDEKKRANNIPVTALRVLGFESQAGGVVGTPNRSWVSKFSGVIKNRMKQVTKTNILRVPAGIKVWPPTTISKEASGDVNAYSSRRGISTLQSLVHAWTDYNRSLVAQEDPVRAINYDNWSWGHNQASTIMSQIANGASSDSTIISTDRDGEIGAALNYSPGGDSWYVGSLGSNMKNFPIYPYRQIEAALRSVVSSTGLPQEDKKAAQRLLRGWRKTGTPHQHRTKIGQTDNTHSLWVINEFLRQFLSSNAESATCSPLSRYVSDKYTSFGFANGRKATRLNLLWTALLQAPAYVPRDREGNVIQKSFEVAYHKNHDTIIKEPSLDRLQSMLDTLMKDKKSSFSEEELIDIEEEDEKKHFSEFLGMNEEEYEEFIDSFNSLTHPPSQEEDSK